MSSAWSASTTLLTPKKCFRRSPRLLRIATRWDVWASKGSFGSSKANRSRFTRKPPSGRSSARYHTALGSLREVLACFEVGAALGYLPEVEPTLRSRFDHVLGTLVRLAGGH